MQNKWAATIIEGCVRNGVTTFCVAPGSRSTPLALAAAKHPESNIVSHFDERGLAFFALGATKASGKPAVIITTSGTAVANCYPAVIEARQSQVPLFVLTADRPPELHHCGANQTIDQYQIFASYPVSFLQLPCATKSIHQSVVQHQLVDAMHQAIQHAGPLHLNWHIREPLHQENEAFDYPKTGWPSLTISKPHSALPNECQVAISQAKRGLVVIGAVPSHQQAELMKMIEQLGWPVISDVQSGLFKHPNILNHAEKMIQKTGDVPDVIIQMGEKIVSKKVLHWLEKAAPACWLRVTENYRCADPIHKQTHVIETTLSNLINELPAPPKSQWLTSLQALSQQCVEEVKQQFKLTQTLTEPFIAHQLLSSYQADTHYFISNSLPIRLCNNYWSNKSNVHVFANRGASGIDGIIATAVGVAYNEQKPVTCLIGDIASLHDLNSLCLLKSLSLPCHVIIINNSGGGIFHHLDVAKQEPDHIDLFTTPHNFSFEKAAEWVDISYEKIKTVEAYTALLKKGPPKTPQITEIIVDLKEPMDMIG